MLFVIDTNRIIAGLLKSSWTRRLLYSPHIEFIAPEYILEEIKKHQPDLIKKSGLTLESYLLLLSLLQDRIQIIPSKYFISTMKVAEETMGPIDPLDIPFLALGLAYKVNGIWTEDKHFKRQSLVNVYSNQDLDDLINQKN